MVSLTDLNKYAAPAKTVGCLVAVAHGLSGERIKRIAPSGKYTEEGCFVK